MANNHLIAIGHRPPHGQLTIVSHPAYGELALLLGERVEDIVEAAEAVIAEKESMPNLGIEPGICPRCGEPSTTIERRRLNTAYVEEDANWLKVCQDCHDEVWEYYEERWRDYYADIIGGLW